MGKKVLIAEDSSVIQNLTRKILEQLRFEITMVKNGQQVIDKIKVEDFDLILMDINMPVLDGIDCTQQIRAMNDQKKSRVPILAITGNAKNYSLEEFKEAGINEYLPKPLDFDNLVKMVIRYTS
ncbi:MAG: response regulator [Bacteroidetes bacterium]|nr:response regulator [Bacteroidota bacterium]MCH8233421.1 response regulator [Bacteroidota bacterium]